MNTLLHGLFGSVSQRVPVCPGRGRESVSRPLRDTLTGRTSTERSLALAATARNEAIETSSVAVGFSPSSPRSPVDRCTGQRTVAPRQKTRLSRRVDQRDMTGVRVSRRWLESAVAITYQPQEAQ